MIFTKDIEFNSNPISEKNLKINYNGELGNSSDVWIVYGFGASWENTTETKMEKTENGFSANITMQNFDTFNFCFKNSNNQWDNNNNFNYITSIEPNVQFNLTELIEEILEPLQITPTTEVSVSDISIEEKEINLGEEISEELSKIENTVIENQESLEAKNILYGNIIQDETFEFFDDEIEENETSENIQTITTNTEIDNIVNQLIENTINSKETKSEIDNNINVIENIDEDINEKLDNNVEKTSEETALIPSPELSVSIRKLSKIHLYFKKIKLALYKAFIKLPKLIFGTNND